MRVALRFSFTITQHHGLGGGGGRLGEGEKKKKKINKFEFSFALLAKNSGSHITLFCLTSRSDMHSNLTDYSLLPTNKLKHVHRQPLSFCLSVYLFIFLGMQHDVIHPPDPFGLPLEYSLLPQELKKVGECESCISIHLPN